MKITTSGKGFGISDSLMERIEKRIAKLDRYFHDDAEAIIRVSQEKGNRNIAEITISASGLLLRAEETTTDMYVSIDKAADKLNRQIRRHRTKLDKKLRDTAFEAPVEADEPAPVEEEPAQYNVVRTKKFKVKAMQIDDAIAQMELLDHDFFLFRDEKTDGICLIYRRNDGAYGLLQPE